MPRFDDYVAFVDESGEHSLQSISDDYPVFALAVCVFTKKAYVDACAASTRLKLSYFPHDQVVLHERNIRRQLGDFKILRDKAVQAAFLSDLKDLVTNLDFTLIASVIRKKPFVQQYIEPEHVYHIALGFCLERLYLYLRNAERCNGGTAHIVFEARGKKEDQRLELEFRRKCRWNPLSSPT